MQTLNYKGELPSTNCRSNCRVRLQGQFREQAANALFNKAVTLHGHSRHDHAITAYDQVVNRSGDWSAPASREFAAKAQRNEGVVLDELGRGDEAVKAYDQVVNRYGDSADPALREIAAGTLFNKAGVLKKVGRREDAVEVVLDKLDRRHEAIQGIK